MYVDENPIIATQYQIMSIPSLLVFVHDELKAKKAGFLTKEALIDFIRQAK